MKNNNTEDVRTIKTNEGTRFSSEKEIKTYTNPYYKNLDELAIVFNQDFDSNFQPIWIHHIKPKIKNITNIAGLKSSK